MTRSAAVPMNATVTASVTEGRKPSTVVVEAIAEAVGVEPMDLDTPLYDVVDPDGLDELFAPTLAGSDRCIGIVTFTIEGCTVRVHGDGTVEVNGPPAR